MTGTAARNLTIQIEGHEDDFVLQSVTAEEGISQCFRVMVHATSPSADLDVDAIVGAPATVTAAFGGGARAWSGVCAKIACTHATTAGASSYELEIVPLLALLGQRTTHRVFQGLSAREIATTILDEWAITASWSTDGATHARYDYRTQYGESDLDFLTRVLADDGIAFAFGDEDGRSVLRFSDALHRAELAGGAIPFAEDASTVGGRRHATALVRSAVSRPGALVLGDFDHRRPAFPVSATALAEEGARRRELHRFQPGVGAVRVEHPDPTTPVADAAHPVRHAQEELEGRARRELARERFDRRFVRFATNAPEARAGAVVQIAGHPRADLGGRLLVVSSRLHTTERHPGQIHVRAAFADAPFEPPRPARVPVHGLQYAIVTGPPGEEIHTDELGRVKVRFPWDRHGAHDDRSSCWVRVSQGWAGRGHGLVALPRVGHEVLVAFVGGDPDHPVVVGRLHDGLHPHAHKLPENKTVTSLRTASSPGGGGFNELRFEDRAGEEHVLLRAQRDQDNVVLRNAGTDVGADWTSRVGRDRTSSVGRDHTSTVEGDERRLVRGSASSVVGGNALQDVTGARTEIVRGAFSATVGGATHEEHLGEVRREERADVIERVEGNRVLVVGRSGARRSLATHVDGDLRTTVTEHVEIRADRELVLACGKSRIRIGPDAIEIHAGSVGIHGEDARVRLASGQLKAFAKTKLQLKSEALVAKSDGASLGLTSDAKLAGAKVKLGATSSADDERDEADDAPTVVLLCDDMGDPIPNQPFRVRLASGAEVTGVLDAQGRAELDLDEDGEIEFPGLHRATEE